MDAGELNGRQMSVCTEQRGVSVGGVCRYRVKGSGGCIVKGVPVGDLIYVTFQCPKNNRRKGK